MWRPRKGQWSRPWALGAEFVRLTLLGTLQYIPFSLLVTAASVVGRLRGCYHEGRFSFDDVYLYAIVVRNWSQCWALYCVSNRQIMPVAERARALRHERQQQQQQQQKHQKRPCCCACLHVSPPARSPSKVC